MKKPSAPSKPGDYIASLPEDRRKTIRTLHTAIRKAAPGLAPAVMSGMGSPLIGYGRFHYKYASGREGDWFTIGLCARKNYYSLYLCAVEDGAYLAEKNASKLGNVKVGRGCITFRKLEDLKLPVAMKLVKRAQKLGGVGAVV
jgi:hypothetical protein